MEGRFKDEEDTRKLADFVYEKEEVREEDPNWELDEQERKFARKHYKSPVKKQIVVQSVTRKQKRFPQKIR